MNKALRNRSSQNKSPRSQNHSANHLVQQAHRLDGRNYGSYKQLCGTYAYDNFSFHIHRVQADPYAPPSACSVTVPVANTGIPQHLIDSKNQRIAAADFLARSFAQAIRTHQAGRDISIARCGQEILERSSTFIHVTNNHANVLDRIETSVSDISDISRPTRNTTSGREATSGDPQATITIRFQVLMPARGRRILGHAAARIFDELIPDIVASTCNFIDDTRSPRSNISTDPSGSTSITDALGNSLSKLSTHVNTYVDFQALQQIRKEHGWVAFVADSAILARESGISDEPMLNAVAFESPHTLRTTVTLPYAGNVSGMAIPSGVTIIAGGGYHGKSTLLQALERSVYAHIPGDGRELVACDPLATKVRSEDGRAVTSVDISRFIRNIPSGKDTSAFSTDNASGSTSQAAFICEVLEAGASALLIDEDTSATNLMIRDERMKRLVRAEPITPFVDRVRELFLQEGVSSILVMGGSGDYLDIADHVLMLQDYRVFDVTEQARKLCYELPRGGGIQAKNNALSSSTPEPLTTKGESATITDDPGAKMSVDKQEPQSPRVARTASPNGWIATRYIVPGSIKSEGKKPRTKSRGLVSITLERSDIDISAIEQIVDPGQAEAIAWALRYICSDLAKSRDDIAVFDALDHVEELMNNHGLDALSKMTQPAFLARPRQIDIASALNRLRTLNIKN